MNAEQTLDFSRTRDVGKFVAFAGVLLMSNAVTVQADEEEILEQYKKLLAQQQKEFEAQRQIIANQGKELEQLKQQMNALLSQKAENKQPTPTENATREPTPPPPQATVVSQAPKAEPVKPVSPPGQLPSKPVGQAPAEATEKPRPPEIPRLSDEVGGVLTRKGNFVVEPSFQYGYTDNSRVFLDAYTFIPAIAIGLIDIRQIKRHTLMGSLAGRYGLTDRLELELKAPYVYRSDTQRSRPVSVSAATDETFEADGMDIGDIEFNARYQLTDGAGGWPILVGNMAATVPTGTSPFDIEYVAAQGVPGATYPSELPTGVGFFSFQPSVTALYPTDPAVFFGNLGYIWNAETSEDFGKYDPGNAIGLSFGMGFGLNERSSFSLGYSHRHVFNSAVNGETIEGSELDIGQFMVGYSFKYSPRTTFNLSLGIGTTDDAQNAYLNLRVPFTFDTKSPFNFDFFGPPS